MLFPALLILMGVILGYWVGHTQKKADAEKSEFPKVSAERDLLKEGSQLWTGWPLPKQREGSEPLFEFLEVEGEAILEISGEVRGGISTREEFSNYHLSLNYRWGDQLWARNNLKKERDSGIIFHCQGGDGEAFGHWRRGVECHLSSDHAGSLWVLGTLAYAPIKKVPKTDGGSNIFFSLYQPVQLVTEKAYSAPSHRPSETGWNQVDLYVVGEQAVYVVNGEVTMLVHSMKGDIESGAPPLVRGAIQLQSHGAEIQYRRLRLSPLQSFPIKLQELFDQASEGVGRKP